MSNGGRNVSSANTDARRGAASTGLVHSLQFLATIGLAAWALTNLVDVRERLARIEERINATANAIEALNRR